MISYELAKALKWPQPERDPHLPGEWITPDGGGHFLDLEAIYSPSLLELIATCIDQKEGNKEFALFFHAPGWSALIGCLHGGMLLGESPGEYEAQGETAEEAVAKLLLKLKTKNEDR